MFANCMYTYIVVGSRGTTMTYVGLNIQIIESVDSISSDERDVP